MAREKSEDRARKRRRGEYDEEENTSVLLKAPNTSDSERLFQIIAKIEPLVEQVNQLYNMYFSGVERRPPLEQRKNLDQMVETIRAMPKPTTAAQFRFNTIYSLYKTYLDRWERLLKQKEVK